MSISTQQVYPVRLITLETVSSPEEAFDLFNTWITKMSTPRDLALVKVYDKETQWQFSVTIHAPKRKTFLHVVVPKTDDYIISEAVKKEKLREEIKTRLSGKKKVSTKKEKGESDDKESDCVSYT